MAVGKTGLSKPILLIRRIDEENAFTMAAIGLLAFFLITFVLVARDPEE